MLKRRLTNALWGIFLLSLSPCMLYAQEDAGLWSSISLQHKFTQRLSAGISEQLRLYQNISAVDQFFTDVSLEYGFTKNFKASLNYRLISKNQLEYYSTRHRFYLDLSYKYKLSPLVLVLRERLQQQVADLNSSDNGHIPEWYSRTKFSVKVDLGKKITPYVAAEMFYLIDDAVEDPQVIDRVRYEAGVDYEFNRRHSLNFFYLIQESYVSDERDFIIGLGYTLTTF